jgi:hypothetical protein
MNIKFFLVLVVGLTLACGGGYLRLHAKSFASQTFSSSDTEPTSSLSSTQEDTSETAALTDISLVLLYGGSSLVVVSVAAWLFSPRRLVD